MDRVKVHCIVEYIRSRGKFVFECDEVIEDLEEVLDYYGICAVLGADERLAVVDELLGMAEAFEVSEAVRRTERELELESVWIR